MSDLKMIMLSNSEENKVCPNIYRPCYCNPGLSGGEGGLSIPGLGGGSGGIQIPGLGGDSGGIQIPDAVKDIAVEVVKGKSFLSYIFVWGKLNDYLLYFG